MAVVKGQINTTTQVKGRRVPQPLANLNKGMGFKMTGRIRRGRA
jgi:hypothetical protein